MREYLFEFAKPPLHGASADWLNPVSCRERLRRSLIYYPVLLGGNAANLGQLGYSPNHHQEPARRPMSVYVRPMKMNIFGSEKKP
jgi:hypothetical protein